ncbi:hypothetical protein CBOM_05173 [Ceraceosorus bombacis]|uniref:Uncharacterized protein n=1 Tax=Ceraceosorus bombacis TaxID=401625 RepID=A0A0P1BIQ2_9BASI|nr:hypothetical protein CBOM_05173 [Ceraceosorus bombacis]
MLSLLKDAQASRSEISSFTWDDLDAMIQETAADSTMQLSSAAAGDADVAPKLTPTELVPSEYHEFLDVFSPVEASQLPPH